MKPKIEQSVTIDVYVDILCPWCYIGKRRLTSALAQLHNPQAVKFRWRSYELGPNLSRIPGKTAAEIMVQMHGEKAASKMADIRNLGINEGLILNFDIARPVNTFEAHQLLHFSRESDHADKMLERLLYAYHTEGLNLADRNVLEKLGVEVGLKAIDISTILNENSYAQAVRIDEKDAAIQGVSGVPTIVINGHAPVSGVQPTALLKRLLELATSRSDSNGQV